MDTYSELPTPHALTADLSEADSIGRRQEIFVCHSSTDQRCAEWIRDELERAGYRVYCRGWSDEPGGNIVLEVGQAIDRVDLFVVVLSEASKVSRWVLFECSIYLQHRELSGNGGRMVVLRAEACEPPPFLSALRYDDLFDCDEAERQRRLLDSVRGPEALSKTADREPGSAGLALRGLLLSSALVLVVSSPGSPALLQVAAWAALVLVVLSLVEERRRQRRWAERERRYGAALERYGEHADELRGALREESRALLELREALQQREFEVVTGRAEIYEGAKELAAQATDHVWSTAFGREKGGGGPDHWLRFLAETVAAKQAVHTGLHHSVIYGPAREQHQRERIEQFQQSGAGSRLFVYQDERDWGMDFMIVDERHLHISFQTHDKPELFMALQFRDNPQVVKPVAGWFTLLTQSTRVSRVYSGGEG